MRYLPTLCAPLLIAACVDSTDPADGGFVNGISGVASGTYDQRLRGDHAAAKNQIVQQRAALAEQGIRLSPASERQVQAALRSNPDRAETLRKAIAEARALSERLARLARS